MHTPVDLKCPEHEQGSWLATVRVHEDGRADVLGYEEASSYDALYEALSELCDALEATTFVGPRAGKSRIADAWRDARRLLTESATAHDSAHGGPDAAE